MLHWSTSVRINARGEEHIFDSGNVCCHFPAIVIPSSSLLSTKYDVIYQSLDILCELSHNGPFLIFDRTLLCLSLRISPEGFFDTHLIRPLVLLSEVWVLFEPFFGSRRWLHALFPISHDHRTSVWSERLV